MRVKAIMIPLDSLNCIQVKDSLEEAIKVIEKKQMLSLPVLEDKRFIGVLSKQFIFESYFLESPAVSKEEFLSRPVSSLMNEKIDPILDSVRIEEAAARFISSKVRFIPVMNEYGLFSGIVTQQAIFKQYQKLFGHRYNSLVIYTHDYRGVVAKITETIAKAGGNIRNMMMLHTNVLNLVEIFLRIDIPDFDKVVQTLKKQGFDVRDVKKEK